MQAEDDLHRVLGEVAELMRADSASLLLLDGTKTALDPFASVGLDRTARLAPRVPVGQGFAGRIASTRMALTLDEVTEANVLNPVLKMRGVRSLLGVPLVDDEELLGVLHVGSRGSRRFIESDEAQLAELGRHVGALVRIQSKDAQHAAAMALQRSLLPALPARIDGLDAAVRYLPAEGDLGGDWYDVFQLPGDRIAVVMGDVVGHGLSAAVVMGRLKSALRAYALEHEDPAVVMSMLDRKICHFEGGALATAIYGVSAPPYREFWFSSAGHWPPLLATAGSDAQVVDLPADLLLGVDPTLSRSSTRVPLPQDALLCMFTDGLVERRSESRPPHGDRPDSGFDRLRSVLDPSMDAETNCRHIVAELVAQDVIEDDVALLVLRAR